MKDEFVMKRVNNRCILGGGVVAAFVCGSFLFAQEPRHLHVPPTPTAVTLPMQLESEAATRKEVGHNFISPPPVPEQIGPAWINRATDPEDESVHGYSLEDLLSMAAQSNPTIRQSRLHINSQLGKAIQAGLYPNPTLRYLGEQIGVGGTAGEWQGAEIEQRFVTGGERERGENRYMQRAKVAEVGGMMKQYRVCNDVRIHFVKALAARQIIDLRKELLKNSEDNLVTIRERYNVGQASRAEAHQANALLQQHRLSVMNAQNDYQQHLLELVSLVGVELSMPKLEGDLKSSRDLIDFDAAYGKILAQSPELCAAHAKLREDLITVQRERVEWVPDIVAGTGAGYNFDARETTYSAMLSLEIPLFDRNQGTIKQAEADYSRQQSEIRRTELDLRRLLSIEYGRYLTAIQNVQNFESVILPERKSAYSLLLSSYKANRIAWDDVLAAYDEYTRARIEYVMNLSAQRTSEILIDGFLLHGGLQTPSGPLPGGHIDSVPKPR